MSYHSVFDLIDDVETKTRRFVNDNMDMVPASDCGLDPRCGRLFVNDEGIAVNKANDRGLQYYGGFEYVDKDYRFELGDFVFYSVDDDRVRDHVETFFAEEEVE